MLPAEYPTSLSPSRWGRLRRRPELSVRCALTWRVSTAVVLCGESRNTTQPRAFRTASKAGLDYYCTVTQDVVRGGDENGTVSYPVSNSH